MRVAVVGVGSVGSVFASELLLAGQHEVLLCARRPFDELVIESPELPAHHKGVSAVIDPAVVDGPVDWVLLTTKAQQIAGAQPWLDRLCGPDTRLVVVQNGIEQAQRGEAAAPQSTSLGAVVYCAGELTAPGRVAHKIDARLHVPANEHGLALVELFDGTRATIDACENWTEKAWRKLLVNAVLNGPCAITGQPGGVLKQDHMVDLIEGIATEAVAVAAASGTDLGDDAVQKLIGFMKHMPDDVRPSMLQDRDNGRKMEHDAIYGGILRLASAHDVDVPRIHAVHAFLDAIDSTLS